jgi:hypothetical protein
MSTGAPWVIGQSVSITWSATDWVDPDLSPLTVKIELSRDNGSTWSTLAAGAPNTGTYTWTVTTPAATQCKIRLSDPDASSVNWTSTAFAINASGFPIHLNAISMQSNMATFSGYGFSDFPIDPTACVWLSADGGATKVYPIVYLSWADGTIAAVFSGANIGTYTSAGVVSGSGVNSNVLLGTFTVLVSAATAYAYANIPIRVGIRIAI